MDRPLIERWSAGATVRELARDLEEPEELIELELRRSLAELEAIARRELGELPPAA